MSSDSKDGKATISLPKGGGAIKGVGETFQPNLFSGTGNFSVPIFTSPGRGGFGPKLTLQYSSGNGNGLFGLGWQLSIPRISRKTEKGLPSYTDEDVFVMSGAEDLVPVLDEQGSPVSVPNQGDCTITRYRPRTEGLFARVEKWSSTETGVVHWRATTKENVTSIYGKTSSARISDPDDSARIYEWLLEETFDRKGNHILYEYIQETATLVLPGLHERNRCYTQAYLRRILYGNTPESLPDEERTGPVREGTDHASINALDTIQRHYLFELVLDYFDLPDELAPGFEWRELDYKQIPADWPEPALRNDPFSSYRSGFEIRTLRRCRRALMLHHFNEGELTDAPLVKSTDFDYGEDPHAGFSILEKARVWGYRKDPDNTTSYLARDMPPVTFGYSTFTPESQRYKAVTAEGGDYPPLALNNPDTRLMDIFGDGLPDVVQSTGNGFHYWRNRGDAHLGRRHPQHGSQPPISFAQPNVSVGDMGGDGLADLVVDAPPMSGFYESTPDGGWRNFKRFESMPSFNLADPDLRLVDLTGDGLSDVLVTRDQHFLWFRSKGEAGYDAPRAVVRVHDLDEFPDVYFSDPAARVRLADMSGDGLNDIVMVHDGRIDYWPNLGYGRFGKRLTMTNTPHIGYGFDPRRLFLADLDGNGCADLVYVDFDRVYFWFNRSGNGWSEEHVIPGTPYVTDLSSVQFADFYGTGTACLIWSYDFGATPGGNYKVLDFCGGRKPHLLIEMSNNMGATTRAQYASSTRFFLEDEENGTPWATHLPFPVQVLEKTEVIDHVGKTKLVTTYKYHHGYYDGREREFRGFGRVDQYDTEEFEAFSQSGLHDVEAAFENGHSAFHVPPVLTKNWFHTGVYFDDNQRCANGRPYDNEDMLAAYREEYYQGDHRAFALGANQVHTDDAEVLHEAYRALRGSLLRSEVYALDGSLKESHPYVVTESRYEIKELQARHGNPHAVFLPVSMESISYQYERDPADPRIGQNLTLAYDDYGNVTRSVSIGYPRRRPLAAFKDDDGNDILGEDGNPIAPYAEQRDLKATYSFADFINRDDAAGYYYVGIPCQTRVFEVHGLVWEWPPADELLSEPLAPLNPAQFDALDNPTEYEPFENDPPADLATPKKRLVDWKRTYFRRDAAPGQVDQVGSQAHRLDHGEIASLALPYESYQAVFTDAQLQQIYQGRQTGFDLTVEGGYQQADGYWWIPSGRQGFDPDKFFAPVTAQDPFNNRSSTEIDGYGLLLTKVTDALPGVRANSISARNDYRVLQPWEVTDPNGNRSQVAFDALGLVVGTAVLGHDVEGNPVGDTLEGFIPDLAPELRDRHIDDPLNLDPVHDNDPHNILLGATTRLLYDLKRFMQTGRPNLVYTLARETHVSDGQGAAGRIQHSFVYSDGFGREAQSKVQAEPGPLVEDGQSVSPRWVGTGSKVFNNKGKPVREYEPFFSADHGFGIEQHGVSPTLFYDPLERVVCTLHPNHTYQKVAFDPWRKTSWDANDTIHPSHRYGQEDRISYRTIDPPGSTMTFATSINNAGEVVGNYRDSSNVFHDFHYTGDNFTTIDFPGAMHTRGASINNVGQMVGAYVDSNEYFHGYFKDESGFISIDFPDVLESWANAINDTGQILGGYRQVRYEYLDYLFDGNNYETITDYPGSVTTRSFGLNNKNEIVGNYTDPNGRHHGMLLVDGHFQCFDYPGAKDRTAFGINEHGQIVGVSSDNTDLDFGFIFEQGVFNKIDFPEAIETIPVNINDHGQITGYYIDEGNVYHGFIAETESSAYERFNPRDDADVGHYFARLPEDDYLPTWYNTRTVEAHALTQWPEQDEEGAPLPEPIRSRNRQRRRSERQAATLAARHSATPAREYLDVLGRAFLTVADNGRDEQNNDNYLRTRLSLDIEGNDKQITDPRDIQAFTHRFDIAGRKLAVESVDAGDKYILLAVDGQPIRTWDANGNHIEVNYDALRRPLQTWVNRPTPHNDRIRVQATLYGESLATDTDPGAATRNHHRGRPYLILDGAGAVINARYDFKGNPLEIRRILARGYEEVPDWADVNLSATVDVVKQQLQNDGLLEQEVFITTSETDALNRVTHSRAPDHTTLADLDGQDPGDGSLYHHTYNEANLLETVEVDLKAERDTHAGFRPFVESLAYNARGQRTAITYGNKVTTHYFYDDQTFRLRRLKSTRQSGDLLQDLHYTYDPVGNITQIRDDAAQTVWHDQQRIDAICGYRYDPLYRLTFATGREHKSIGAAQYRNPNAFKQSAYHPLPPPTTDAQALQMYAETYAYDVSGNIEEVKHRRGASPDGPVLWTRRQTYAADCNRIRTSGASAEDPERGDQTATYGHDANGNFLRLPQLRNGGADNAQNLFWDYRNQLIRAELDLSGNVAYYAYDGAGQRTRKVVIKGANREERIYLGGFEIYREWNRTNTLTLERHTLHVMDDKARIALVEYRTIGTGNGEAATRFRYQLSNQLGSSATEVDETEQARIICYEEYFPYGGTSYIGGTAAQDTEKIASSKRYRYTGKERDDETGLYYFGVRYYVSWLGSWISTDPLGVKDGTNLYNFVGNNPVKWRDRWGMFMEPTDEEAASSSSIEGGSTIGSGPEATTNPPPGYVAPSMLVDNIDTTEEEVAASASIEGGSSIGRGPEAMTNPHSGYISPSMRKDNLEPDSWPKDTSEARAHSSNDSIRSEGLEDQATRRQTELSGGIGASVLVPLSLFNGPYAAVEANASVIYPDPREWSLGEMAETFLLDTRLAIGFQGTLGWGGGLFVGAGPQAGVGRSMHNDESGIETKVNLKAHGGAVVGGGGSVAVDVDLERAFQGEADWNASGSIKGGGGVMLALGVGVNPRLVLPSVRDIAKFIHQQAISLSKSIYQQAFFCVPQNYYAP